MRRRVGIPRGLFYYKYFSLWKEFFEGLGAEVILSKPTNKEILDNGTRVCVDEACLPVKIFHGHVIDLKDKVDYLFIPRFTSISRNEYVCPKFGGLPDMVRQNIKGLPQIINTEVNLRKSSRGAFKAALEMGRYICSSTSIIKKSYIQAMQKHQQYKKDLMNGLLIGDVWDKEFGMSREYKNNILTIALFGHEYNLYDSYVNMNTINKLKCRGVKIVTIDMMDPGIINAKAQTLPKKMFWNYGRKAVGAALHILDRNDVDGIIYIMSFGCGIDSFVCDLIERKIRRNSDIPFIILTIDEHTGEAGINTRLEAFVDMLRWRRKDEGNIPSYG